jgi:hypothetical protein
VARAEAARPLKVSTAEVWRQARAMHPAGTRLVRVIDMDTGLQIFQPIPETELNFMDGATIVRPSLPTTHTIREWQDVIAAWDAHFMGVTV